MTRSTLIAFALVSSLFTGCYSSHEVPDVSELIIESGDMPGTALRPGTEGALITSVSLTSDSERTLEVLGIPVNLHGVLSEDLSASITNMRFVRGGDRAELTAALQPGDGYQDFLTFEEPITLAPGESLTLILVADIPADASNRVEIEIGAPSATGRCLFPAIAYADSGEWVSEELVYGNVAHSTHIIIGE